MNGLLVLANGARFKGTLLGNVEGFGELVFRDDRLSGMFYRSFV